MLIAVTTCALVAAIVCVLAALGARPPARRSSAAAAKSSRPAAILLSAGIVFMAIAAAVSVLDAKLPDAAAVVSEQPRAAAPEAGSTWPLADLSAFRGAPKFHTRVSGKGDLCLVRYYQRDAGKDPGANWWTTCSENRGLRSVEHVRERLALLRSWGRRDTRVIAEIPKGEAIVFLRGRAARQCERDRRTCYPGGGTQLLFRDADFKRSWFVRHECAQGPEHLRLRFKACAG